ncbi:MAG: peptide chain release factor N(5)-glutamine methyltransferase [Candidatus Cloacimonetes bacterium]|nr:peptide chain release factor N(5)-glutamine methyltransferase [Candidatus Cloacimonadota bacterium]
MKNWTILEIIKWTTDFFKEKQIEKARLNAEYIVAHVLQCKRFDLYVRFEDIVSEIDRAEIRKLIVRRCKNEPLQYVLGETEFYGYRFFVNSAVLIPRPETEYLVEKIIKENPSLESVLDIGTGSGAIAVSLKKELPNCNVTASDISEKALEIAKKNAAENQVTIEFIQSDLFENIEDKYSVIVSNPPYIPLREYKDIDSEVKDFEPQSALLAEADGLHYYQKILEQAKEYLHENGIVYFEIGHDQAERIKKIAENNGFFDVETLKDLNEFDRMMRIK